jgi:hypothetical protein
MHVMTSIARNEKLDLTGAVGREGGAIPSTESNPEAGLAEAREITRFREAAQAFADGVARVDALAGLTGRTHDH